MIPLGPPVVKHLADIRRDNNLRLFANAVRRCSVETLTVKRCRQNSIFRRGSFDEINRSNRMEFCPAVLSVKDVGPCSCNPMADGVSGKILAEAIAHAFFDGISLRNTVAAHWLQDEIALLLL